MIIAPLVILGLLCMASIGVIEYTWLPRLLELSALIYTGIWILLSKGIDVRIQQFRNSIMKCSKDLEILASICFLADAENDARNLPEKLEENISSTLMDLFKIKRLSYFFFLAAFLGFKPCNIRLSIVIIIQLIITTIIIIYYLHRYIKFFSKTFGSQQSITSILKELMQCFKEHYTNDELNRFQKAVLQEECLVEVR